MTKLHYNIKLDIPQDADSARYFIPEGYTARVEDGVLIIEPKKSEDERIRKAIIELLKEVGRDDTGISENAKCMIAYLERQKDSPMPEDTVVFQKGVEEGRRLEREDLPYWQTFKGIGIIVPDDYILAKFGKGYKLLRPGDTIEIGTEFLQVSQLDNLPKEEQHKEQKPRWEINNPHTTKWTREMIDEKFEELVEPKPEWSEDERIRKALISLVDENAYTYKSFAGVDLYSMLAWLEKQKEPTEELSTRLNGLMQEYVKSGKDEEEQEHRLKCYHLFWDALSDSEFFKQKEQKSLLPEDKVKHSLYVEGFEAGKEVGRQYEKVFGKQKEDKSEWSEEDEEIFNLTIIHLLSYAYPDNPIYCEEAEKCVAWFKSLKNRGNFSKGSANSPNVWSDEDEWARNYLIEHLTNGMWIGEESERKLVTWLKSFRPQPKQEWSKIDEHMSNGLIKALENLSSD